DYFPCFLADGFQCVGVNALPRIRIHIGVAGNRVVLAVVVGSGLKIDRLPFRIRDFGSDLKALSNSFEWRRLGRRRLGTGLLRFLKIEFPCSNDGVSLRKGGER